MNEANLTLAATWILIAVLLIVQPWLTRRNVLFGVVFGSDDIWRDEAAKRLRMRYLFTTITGAIVISVAVFLYGFLAHPAEAALMNVYLIGIAALLVYGTVIFIIFHAGTRALKLERGTDAQLVSAKISVETSLPDRQTVISAGWLLFLLPVLAAAYAVVFLGHPPMTAEMRRIAFPMLVSDTVLAAVFYMCCLFTRRAPASVRGNPEAAPNAFRFRKYMIALMILLGVLAETQYLLALVGFRTAVPIPFYFILGALMILCTAALFYLYFRFVREKKPKGPILDDDAKWVLGMFYYNPMDPSVFVEKRTGIGYTLNFARPVAWVVILGIVACIVGSLVATTH